ncbi:hypothetical protein BDV10DRAFT_68440 [Aspergillus recurvatus]
MVAFHRIKSSSFLDSLPLPFHSGPPRPLSFSLLYFCCPILSPATSEWWGWSLAGPVAFLTFGSPYNTQLLPSLQSPPLFHPVYHLHSATTIVGSRCRAPDCCLPRGSVPAVPTRRSPLPSRAHTLPLSPADPYYPLFER